MQVMDHQVVHYHHHFRLHHIQLMIYYKCLFLIDLIIFVVYFVLRQLMYVMYNVLHKLVVQWFDFVINNKKCSVNYLLIISRFIFLIAFLQNVFSSLSLAVANTDLTRYFLVCEPKLRALLYTIRLWIKQKDLLGKGHRFNTYTLFWMIVCTLQLENKQVPSVESLAELASKSKKIIFYLISYVYLAHKRQHGPWNCSVPDINQIEKNLSDISIGNIPVKNHLKIKLHFCLCRTNAS